MLMRSGRINRVTLVSYSEPYDMYEDSKRVLRMPSELFATKIDAVEAANGRINKAEDAYVKAGYRVQRLKDNLAKTRQA